MRLLRAVGWGTAYAAAAAVTAMAAFCLLAPPVIAMREGRTGALLLYAGLAVAFPLLCRGVRNIPVSTPDKRA